MNIRALIRIYFTNGSNSFNDELINKLVEIDFINRHKFQVIYFCIFLVIGVLSNLGYGVFMGVQIISIIYLSIDMFLLIKNIKFREQKIGILFYEDISFLQRLRMSALGMINIIIFLAVCDSVFVNFTSYLQK